MPAELGDISQSNIDVAHRAYDNAYGMKQGMASRQESEDANRTSKKSKAIATISDA